MNIITAYKISTGTEITVKIPSLDLAKTHAASYRANANYRNVVLHENTSTVPAVPAAPAVKAEPQEQTGRVGNGHHVHRLVGSHSACGASFRRGLGAHRPVFVTGEQVTCGNCR